MLRRNEIEEKENSVETFEDIHRTSPCNIARSEVLAADLTLIEAFPSPADPPLSRIT